MENYVEGSINGFLRIQLGSQNSVFVTMVHRKIKVKMHSGVTRTVSVIADFSTRFVAVASAGTR